MTRFSTYAISLGGAGGRLMPTALVLVGAVLIGVSGWGWALVAVGLVVALAALPMRAWLATVADAQLEIANAGERNKSITPMVMLAVLAVLLPLIGSAIILLGTFV